MEWNNKCGHERRQVGVNTPSPMLHMQRAVGGTRDWLCLGVSQKNCYSYVCSPTPVGSDTRIQPLAHVLFVTPTGSTFLAFWPVTE